MGLSLDALTRRSGIVPPAAPLAMPAQSLAMAGEPQVDARGQGLRTAIARIVTFGGALALTAYAAYEMVLIVSLANITVSQWLLVVLFTVTFGWIALAAAGALAGLLPGGDKRKSQPDATPRARTVLLMPVFNEDPARTFAALNAMGAGLAESGLGDRFEIFVISDTNDPDLWIRETAAIHALRESLSGKMDVWYRRRHEPGGKKAGNVQEFVTRWGARYEFMIVLDADSILAADTLAAMACEMEADPGCAILQTLPVLYGGKTLFSRLQQFASVTYGPVVARGINAWQGEDGNYWGHNAIIRVEAFAASAGLPTLPGRKPFGGEILSHDFVEAALIRRAGWSVRMLTALGGSWEEGPPSLLDAAARDRRWAQGNLQHLRVVPAEGLRWGNRAHMLIGVMSYLASPIWLALILAGLAITAQVASVEFEYFTNDRTLFPRWPVFDSERMIALFVLTMGVLLLPKALGVLLASANKARRRGVGIVSLCCSALVETLLSVLYSPIAMLIQTQQLWEILRGRDSGWNVQQRTYRALPWRTLFKRHAWHVAVGVALAAALARVSVPLLIWMSPTLAGLVLAVPLSAMSGSIGLAHALRVVGLLSTPEEVAVPSVVQERDRFEPRLREVADAVTFETLLRDDRLRHRHFAIVSAPLLWRGQPDIHRASVRIKIADGHSSEEIVSWLSSAETLALLSDRDIFEAMLESRRGADATFPPNNEGRGDLLGSGLS